MVGAGAQLEVDLNGCQKVSPERHSVQLTAHSVWRLCFWSVCLLHSLISSPTLKKSLRLPQRFVQAGDSAVRPHKAGKTDPAVEAGPA